MRIHVAVGMGDTATGAGGNTGSKGERKTEKGRESYSQAKVFMVLGQENREATRARGANKAITSEVNLPMNSLGSSKAVARGRREHQT